ncbi:hypothetical protein [Megamonas hypermegale]|uniref:hypothetical protein n=1 Tax=Megamonas hypermegale TaxID=158847 RepID=UPI0025A49B0D|nr:hypothetical protein [Megamonas hypermegale]MDM8143179.1 hypothetical protein [Megamonas hypermegale]
MCEHTWLDGTQWQCWLMKRPCPYVVPRYTKECIEMNVQIKTGKWHITDTLQKEPR